MSVCAARTSAVGRGRPARTPPSAIASTTAGTATQSHSTKLRRQALDGEGVACAARTEEAKRWAGAREPCDCVHELLWNLLCLAHGAQQRLDHLGILARRVRTAAEAGGELVHQRVQVGHHADHANARWERSLHGADSHPRSNRHHEGAALVKSGATLRKHGGNDVGLRCEPHHVAALDHADVILRGEMARFRMLLTEGRKGLGHGQGSR